MKTRETLDRFVLSLAAAFGITFAWIWIRAAIAMAHHGFDLSDESFYLLSYRWWSVNPRTYTGNQYVYGPIFQLLDYDIARLRLFRFFTIVATHSVFGWTFMQWLRQRRPKASPSRLWDIAGAAAIVAASGMNCSWLPLSPGYNDVAGLGAVLGAAFALAIATLVERKSPIPRWLPIAFGFVIVGVTFVKWSSSVTALGPALFVTMIWVTARGWREVVRVSALLLAGTLLAFVLLNVFVVRVDKVWPEMLAVNRIIAKTTAPKTLLEMYWDTSVAMVKTAIARHDLLILASAVAVVSRTRGAQVFAALLGMVGIHRSLTHVEADYGLVGGTGNLSNYAVTIHVFALAGLAMAITGMFFARFAQPERPSISRDSWRGWLTFGLLAALPVTHGLGTGNQIYVMIVNGFALWMAILVAIVTGLDTAPRVARWMAGALAAGAIVSSVSITKTGLLEHPYRTDAFETTTSTVPGVPALASIKLSPGVAEGYGHLHKVLERYIEPKGRAMMGFDEIAGVLFMLDGRPVGEAWSSAADYARTAENLRVSCADGHPWWQARWPILIFTRNVTETETNALKDCGIDFATQYKQAAPGETMGWTIYVPTRE